jgi:hypothetical protein
MYQGDLVAPDAFWRKGLITRNAIQPPKRALGHAPEDIVIHQMHRPGLFGEH